MRSRPPGVFNTTRQLALVFCGFIIVILLVESRGLESWAERLEVGPLRTVAIRVASAWRRAVQPLGLESFRETAIADLEKTSWSDSPAKTAASEPTPAPVPDPKPPDIQKAAPKPDNVKTPVAASVPRATNLPPLGARPQGRPRVIALTGDSMMTVGLSAVLLRETASRQDIHVVKAFKSGTGLARPEVFDWMRQYPAMLASARPDIVIVALGANDGQGFVEQGEVLQFGSEKWTEIYRRRLAGFLQMITADGAQVLWLGLPPMKLETYNHRMETMNRIIYTAVAEQAGATWWNPTPYIGDEAGAFREFVTLPDGRTLRVRASDGIHLSDEGAAILISELMRWLDAPPGAPPSQAGHAAAAVVAPSKQSVLLGTSP
jgi:hypothetical protein